MPSSNVMAGVFAGSEHPWDRRGCPANLFAGVPFLSHGDVPVQPGYQPAVTHDALAV
ncbi:hypothetical protein ACFLQU_02125 [Verrucomicrobiota bacterium]